MLQQSGKVLGCQQPAAVDLWQMLQAELARCWLPSVSLWSSLQSLTFDECFSHFLQSVTLLRRLLPLTLGVFFSLVGFFLLPRCMQPSIFSECSSQSLQGGELPSSLQSLTFGFCFSRCLLSVALLRCLLPSTFGEYFNRGLQGAELQSSLQSLAFLVASNLSFCWDFLPPRCMQPSLLANALARACKVVCCQAAYSH